MNKNIFLSILLLSISNIFSAAKITSVLTEDGLSENSGLKRPNSNSDADDNVTNKKIKTETNIEQLNNSFLDAAKNNNIELVKELLNEGVDPNFTRIIVERWFGKRETVWKKEYNIGPALGFAIINRNVDLVKLLLENKADPNRGVTIQVSIGLISNRGEYSKFLPLEEAIENKLYKIIDLLISYGAKCDVNALFIDAVESNDKPLVELMLEKNADLNTIHHRYNLPAIYLAREKDDIFKLLISRGADINITYAYPEGTPIKHFYTPLIHFVYDAQYPRVKDLMISSVKLLLEFGADLNIRTSPYGSALDLAIKNNDTEMCKLLTEEPERRANEVSKRQKKIFELIYKYILNMPKALSNLIAEYAIKDYEDIATELRANADKSKSS